MNNKRMWNFALAASLLVASLIIVTLLAGVQYNTVRSGSMAPTIGVGDVVVVVPTSAADIKVNDVIAFRSPSSNVLICHRVISINQTAGYVQTKGDANEDPDYFVVTYDRIVGKVPLHIPYLGYLLSYATSLYGIGTTIMWLAIVLVCDELIKDERKKKAKDETGGSA
jgi:signal peptidase I